jgi:hypothetical protein
MDGTGGDSGGSTGDTTSTDGDADGGGSVCDRRSGENPHAGGTPTSDPIQNDAGLQQVVDKIKSIRSDNDGSWPTDSENETKTVPLEAGDQIEVSNAVVTATSYKSKNTDNGQQHFWLEDSQTTLIVYLDMGEEIDCPIVRVGDRVSFTVTGVELFRGDTPQISTVENYRRSADAASDAVPVMEKTGETIALEEFGKIVRVSGQITNEQEPCGGTACFDLSHGGETVTYRAKGPVKPAVGDCVTYVGPVSSYPGPLSEQPEKEVQLESTNLDWVFIDTPMDADAGTGTCESADFFKGQIFTPENRN